MAFEIRRTTYTASSREFYIPPTSKSDFVNLVNTQIDHFTGTYTVLRDWYEQFAEDYEPVQVRATYYPIDWKSKIGNSDMAENFKCPHGDVVIVKGDIIINEAGEPLMLNWKVSDHINNQASQAVICNEYLTFERYVPEETDSLGYVISEAHRETVLDRMPVNITPYAGRPDYTTSNNTPGIVADSLYVCQLQLNPKSAMLRINDECAYGNDRYRIVNIDWSETNIEQDRGILNLNMRRVGGGTSYGS